MGPQQTSIVKKSVTLPTRGPNWPFRCLDIQNGKWKNVLLRRGAGGGTLNGKCLKCFPSFLLLPYLCSNMPDFLLEYIFVKWRGEGSYKDGWSMQLSSFPTGDIEHLEAPLPVRTYQFRVWNFLFTLFVHIFHSPSQCIISEIVEISDILLELVILILCWAYNLETFAQKVKLCLDYFIVMCAN